FGTLFEFPDQAFGIESIARLPELEHHKPADKGLVERPGREHAKVVDVARLIALVASADLLGDDLGQSEAGDARGHKWQVSKVALLDLRQALSRQGRRFAAADLQLDLAVTPVPLVNVAGVHAP